jgi:benzoylformate decarboxylase
MTEYSAATLLVEQLAAENTQVVFGTSSSARSPVLAEILKRRKNMSYVTAMLEQIAALIAIGYAQASAKPGVVYVTGAPGLANTMSAIYNAARERVPLIVLVDQQDTQILNDEPPLSGDLLSPAASLCKWTAELKTAAEMARFIRRAFHEALTPPNGPVVLSLPSNILLNRSVGVAMPSPHTSSLGPADGNFIRKTAEALIKAKNPCVIVGNEVSQYRARKEAVSLVEVIGCPAYTEPLPSGVNFPNRHSHFGGFLPINLHDAHRVLENHDVCLILGMQNRMPPRAQEPPLINRSAYVIQLNVEHGLAGRSLPCNASATADLSESLSRIRAELQLIVDSSWVTLATERAKQTMEANTARRARFEESLVYPPPQAEIDVIWLLRWLDKVRPENSSIVCDLVCDNGVVTEAITMERSFSFFSSNAGVAGYAPAAALGIQWASPTSPIICLTSIDSFMRTCQVLASAQQFALPVRFIVVHPPPASGVGFQPVNIFDKPYALRHEPTLNSLVGLSLAMGVPAARITQIGEIEPALRTMLDQPGCSLLEVCVKN